MSVLRRTTALIALLAYFALSTFGAGWVVCTGADGHAAIESLTAGCCSDGGNAAVHRDHTGGDHRACDLDGHPALHTGLSADTIAVDCASIAAASVSWGDCDGCGDCDDVALSDLTQARRTSNDDVPSLPTALADCFASSWLLPARLKTVVVGVAPRPPPQLRILACTVLRL